ncbi:MAG: glutamine-hydrolyzing GMP synthase subunit GuaA, partial [Spirochaetes bacterium]|nr:glutamine-hydrolyzing GMP synthase subunit GuaA [Candidatus Ornithospirochaeta stercoripullorum]
IRGGKRTFEYPVIIRAVNTKDAMTATVENVPFELLSHITERILDEVKGVNRVCYDMSPKPYATIEWE